MTTSIPSTPTSQTEVVSTPPTGTWRHPRFEEIAKRQNAARFTEKNVTKILWNGGGLFLSFLARGVVRKLPFIDGAQSLGGAEYIITAIRVLFFFNILVALYPLVRKSDDFSDIPLTPSQRALLGLDPNATPPLTPGGHYITPPRYSKSSSRGGTPGSRSSSYSNSPLSQNGSANGPKGQGGLSYSPSSPSPLFQKAMQTSRRNSYGSGSQLGASAVSINNMSLSALPPTPSPTNGKTGASVGLNNRWLYERGRASPGGRSFYS